PIVQSKESGTFHPTIGQTVVACRIIYHCTRHIRISIGGGPAIKGGSKIGSPGPTHTFKSLTNSVYLIHFPFSIKIHGEIKSFPTGIQVDAIGDAWNSITYFSLVK